MSFHVLGINHHSAPLEVREKLAFPAERQAEALAELVGQAGVSEAVLVSTCNRTEVYCRAEDPAALRAWLNAAAERVGLALDPYLYCTAAEPPMRTASRVPSGLARRSLGGPRTWAKGRRRCRVARA